MASDIENSLKKLLAMGFRLFPLESKELPATEDFANLASNDQEKIKKFWTCTLTGEFKDFIIGISTRNLVDGWRLIGMDVDNKKGRQGDDDLLRLELQGQFLPETFEQLTPTGGRHLIFRTRAVVGNSSKRVAQGIDIRGRGGYLVGAGSKVDGKLYTANFAPIAEAPTWLVDAAGDCRPGRIREKQFPAQELDEEYARKRGQTFVSQSPPAVLGSRGASAYVLAARLKDFGVSALITCEILEDWADRCDPPMPYEELILSVEHAFAYGKNAPGIGAPENAFDEIPIVEKKEKESPMIELNKEYAFVLDSGTHFIIHETTDAAGRLSVKCLSEPSFHRKLASKTMFFNGKTVPVTKVWMGSSSRRSYSGFCFRPEQPTEKGFYNLWRGFSVKPTPKGTEPSTIAKRGVDRFLEHALNNICDGDVKLFHWLIGYFAHFVQRPWDKPHTALVFRGLKGVGKNVLIDQIGHLVGNHYTLASDSRYLFGNFNSHLENCLLFVLDEAFWSGDQKAEGRLKDLITGKTHNIERKGQEPYSVANCTRVVIIGNAEWVVPMSHDERRYAVFEVGSDRREDTKYFNQMIEDLKAGGHEYLLRYLLDYEISHFDFNKAPNTKGGFAQKMESLTLIHQWWHESLCEGQIIEGVSSEWPRDVSKIELRDAYARYLRTRNMRSGVPSCERFGKQFCVLFRKLKTGKMGFRGSRYNAVVLPTLDECRKDFASLMKYEVDWE